MSMHCCCFFHASHPGLPSCAGAEQLAAVPALRVGGERRGGERRGRRSGEMQQQQPRHTLQTPSLSTAPHRLETEAAVEEQNARLEEAAAK